MHDFFGRPDPEDPGSPADRPDTDIPLPDRPDPAADTDTAARPPFLPGRLHPQLRRPLASRVDNAIAGAMRYRAEKQLVPSGGTLLLEVSESAGEGIAPSGDGGLLLQRGRCLVSFAADAQESGQGELGAVFSLNGATLPFTAALLPAAEGGRQRIALTALLDLRAAAILTVENNCGGAVGYENAVLTALKLS